MPERPTWVELRIHGVSGTPPEDLLASAHVVQVAGDAGRRIYQRANSDRQPVGVDPDGRLLEGYHWGNLTSGSWRQALWMLLIPFGLINASQFMLPYPPEKPPGDQDPRSAWQRFWDWVATGLHVVCAASLRFVAISMTCVLALTVTFILVVLVGVKSLSKGDGPTVLYEGGGAALGLAATVAGVFFLYWVGGRTHPFTTRHDEQSSFAHLSGLARWGFFKGDPSSPNLRRLHLAAALVIASMPGAKALEPYTSGLLGMALFTQAAFLGYAICVAVLLIGDPSGSESERLQERRDARVAAHKERRRDHPDRQKRWRDNLAWTRENLRSWQGRQLLVSSWWGRALGVLDSGAWFARSLASLSSLPILLGAIAVVAQEFADLWGSKLPPGSLYVRSDIGDRVDNLAYYLLGMTVVSMMVLFTANIVLAFLTHDSAPLGARRYFGRYAGGLATSLVSTVGVFVGLGFCGSFAFASAKALGVPNADFPHILQRIAYSWGLTAIIVVLIMVVHLTGWFWYAAAAFPSNRRPWWPRPQLRSLYASRANISYQTIDPLVMSIPPAWEPKVATAMWLARVKRSMSWVVVVFALSGIAMSVVAGYEDICAPGGEVTSLTGQLGGVMCEGPSGDAWSTLKDKPWSLLSQLNTDENAQFFMWLGTTTLVALALALVAVGRGAIREQSKRRGANVLWDVIAFWPHAAHPYAPPPYSQLAVLHFRDRILWHLYDGNPPPSDPEDTSVSLGERFAKWLLGFIPWPPKSPERDQRDADQVVRTLRDRLRRVGLALLPWLRKPTDDQPLDVIRIGPHREPTGKVVIAAHSQGSLIAVSALMWLSKHERDRVSLVTFGSQLQVAFPRAFPHYVNYPFIDGLHHEFGDRWVNLYRETDPIAGPVLSWRHWEPKPDESAAPSGRAFRAPAARWYERRWDAVVVWWAGGLRRYFVNHPADRREVRRQTLDPQRARDPYPYRSSRFDAPLCDDDVCPGGMRVCGNDWRLLDPVPYDLHMQKGPVAKIRGHSDYFDDPHYPLAVERVRRGAPLFVAHQLVRAHCACEPEPDQEDADAAPGTMS